jgi:hypothetical protein
MVRWAGHAAHVDVGTFWNLLLTVNAPFSN